MSIPNSLLSSSPLQALIPGVQLPECSEETRFTIHRRTASHHGRTLQTLGHAAEYLAESMRDDLDPAHQAADREAIHILMRLSREIFDDYVAANHKRRPITDWLMSQAVRVYGAA